MSPLACSGFVVKLGAFLSTYPFGSLLMRNGSGDLRRSATQKVRGPVHPKHVSWAAMFTMNHAAESAANSRDSQASTTHDTSMNIRTQSSAGRALEEARKAVRKKRQQAKNRRASDVATTTSRDRDTNTTAVVPGTQSRLDEAALTNEGNHAPKGRGLRTYDGERSRVRGRRQLPKEIGRGGRGVMRGRVLPDYTEIDTSGFREDNNANGSGEAVELSDEDDASAQALVAAIRATLVSTAAQVEERKSRAATTAAEDGDGDYDLTQDEFAPKGWLRVVGLIRRACAGIKFGVDDDKIPPPRIAFELALHVCALCSRPDAGLEVLSLMRSTALEPSLEAYKVVMKGYSSKRRQGRALFTLQTMMAVREAGIVPDLEMLSVATEACSKARDREGALHFMDQAFKLGLDPDERMYREAIIAYSQTGKWLEARDLALRWRDRALSLASSSAAPLIGESMPLLPTADCNTAVLKAMGKAGRVDEALSWLGDIVSSAASIASEANSHQYYYDKNGVEGMRDALPRSPRRNKILLSRFVDESSFLAVLSACSRTGRWEWAVEMLRMMKEDAGIAPEATAFNTALAAFEHRSRTSPSMSTSKEEMGEPSRGSQRWRAALDLLSKMEERGLAPDVVAYNRVINVLRWAGQRERALNVLEDMKRRSAGGLSRVRPDVITYNSAIAACAAGSDSMWEKAVQLLNEMRRKDLKPDRYSYTSAIHACAKAGNPVDALRLLRSMEANDVKPDVIAMTACIDALASGGRWSEAVGLLDEMRTKGIAPNERTYQAAIQACGNGGQWQRALELLALLEARPSGATVQEYNCAMMACVAGGESMRALDVFERVKRSKGGINSGPDMLTYTSAITACASEGEWKTALELLEEMRRAGPRAQPNVKSYTAAIAACGRAGEWRRALDLHSRLSEEGLAPDAASFNAVISAARRGGQHDLAMELLSSMLQAGLSPDDITVAELVSSLSDRGKWDEAIQALEIAARTGAIPVSFLDGDFEVDVSNLPSAIARVKVRATLQRILDVWRRSNYDPDSLRDLVFVTGTGNIARNSPPVVQAVYSEGHGRVRASRQSLASDGEGKGEGWRAQRYSDRSFSLGKMLAEDLRTAYSPPLHARAQSWMAGCLVVGTQDLVEWASAQGP